MLEILIGPRDAGPFFLNAYQGFPSHSGGVGVEL